MTEEKKNEDECPLSRPVMMTIGSSPKINVGYSEQNVIQVF